MNYKEQIDQAKRAAEKWKSENPIVGVGRLRVDLMVDDLCRSITDLLARLEDAEARCKRLDEARERANEACAKWEYRAEKAERERDAAIKELDDAAKAVDYLSDFIDEQIHPIVPYDIYLAIRENADGISMWQYEAEWRGQKEE